jgi:hypothetical protein
MPWEPQDRIRIVALVGALVMFLLGAIMMWKGVSAEGIIDLKSSLISGSLKTGSAGLFICFLSFVMIVFIISNPSNKPISRFFKYSDDRSRFKKLLPVFFALLTIFSISVAAAAFGREIFGFLAFGSGFLLLIVTVGMLEFLGSE